MMSAGRRSGVNWSLVKSESRAPDKVLIIMVFARPGTPSIKMCPFAISPNNIFSTTSSCPTIVFEISSFAFSITLEYFSAFLFNSFISLFMIYFGKSCLKVLLLKGWIRLKNKNKKFVWVYFLQQLECSDSKIIAAAIVITICAHVAAGCHQVSIMIASASIPLLGHGFSVEHVALAFIGVFFFAIFFFAIFVPL
jgi:hypothetical protein